MDELSVMVDKLNVKVRNYECFEWLLMILIGVNVEYCKDVMCFLEEFVFSSFDFLGSCENCYDID